MNSRSLTLYDVLLIVVIIFLLLAVLLESSSLCGTPGMRAAAAKMMNGHQMRHIHSAMVLFSDDNSGYYPGIMSDGVTIDPAIGLTPQGRVDRLVELNLVELSETRSVLEKDALVSSYALLQINVNHDGQTVAIDDRNAQWRNTGSDRSVVISDRAIPVKGSLDNIRSLHTLSAWGKSEWQGSVIWNDNHITFENTRMVPTQYGHSEFLIDDLFASPGDAYSGNDAFMVWSGTNTL